MDDKTDLNESTSTNLTAEELQFEATGIISSNLDLNEYPAAVKLAKENDFEIRGYQFLAKDEPRCRRYNKELQYVTSN